MGRRRSVLLEQILFLLRASSLRKVVSLWDTCVPLASVPPKLGEHHSEAQLGFSGELSLAPSLALGCDLSEDDLPHLLQHMEESCWAVY